MSEPFLGEIRLTSFNFPPAGWLFCNGQLLPIQQNAALYSVIGITYGGDGSATFALPDLQGRIPLHFGSGFTIGEPGGEATHVLTISETPAHKHPAAAQTVATNPGGNPTNSVWAASGQAKFAASPNVTMSPAAIGNAGNNLAHENLAPYLTLSFIIALQGIYPSRG